MRRPLSAITSLVLFGACGGGGGGGTSATTSSAAATTAKAATTATATATNDARGAATTATATETDVALTPHKIDAAALADLGQLMGAAHVEAATEIDFSGEYVSSSGGEATVTQEGGKITIKYDKGEADCEASGQVLHCTWEQPNKTGDAIFLKTPSGALAGTWGRDHSDTDAGGWAFYPKDFEVTTLPQGVNLAGRYDSSYGGEMVISAGGPGYVLSYKNGEGECVGPADVLVCSWTQKGKSGHAIFAQNEDGSLFGNWGKGDSYGSGGVWTLTPTTKAPTEPAPSPSPSPPPAPPPSNPSELAADGLPVDIPAPSSKAPTVEEWRAVPRECTVRHSSALNCETKMLREWLRVSCRQNQFGTPTSVTTTYSSGQQAYPQLFGGTLASNLVQVVRNKHYESLYVWDDTSSFTLVVDWPNGAPRPVIYFQ